MSLPSLSKALRTGRPARWPKRRSGLVLFALLLLWTVAACNAPAPAPTPTVAPQPTVTPPPAKALWFGAALPLSGDLSRIGQTIRTGYDIGAAAINQSGGISIGGETYQVGVRYADLSDPAAVAAQIRQWLEQGNVDFILSPLGRPMVEALLPVLSEYSLPLVDINDTTSALYPTQPDAVRGPVWLFGLQQPAKAPLTGYFDMLRSLSGEQLRAVGISFVGSPEGLAQSQALAAYAQALDFTTAGFTTAPTGETDIDSLRSLQGQPDLIISQTPARAIPAMVQAIDDAGLAPRLWAFDEQAGSVSAALGDQAENALLLRKWSPDLDIYGDVVFPSAADYASFYQAGYQAQPSQLAAAATASLLALKAATEGAGSLDGQAVRDALSILDIDTFFGPIAFVLPPDQAGNGRPTGRNAGLVHVIAQMQDGQAVPIWPRFLAQGNLRLPEAQPSN